jgi:cyclophilin family peptidyl-prolyl cis-trans isomerase
MGLIKDIFEENKKILLLSLGLLVAAFGSLLFTSSNLSPTSPLADKPGTYREAEDVLEQDIDYHAVLKTSFGDIKIDLYEKETPIAVNNFLFLAGERFYDNVTFHRVVRGFVIQAGDPTATGRGGPGYTFEDELRAVPFKAYSVGMAKSEQPNTNGSQFFIVSPDTIQSDIDALTGKYTLFGEVTSGFAVVDSIERVETDANDKPINPVTIESVQILES